MKHNFTTWLEVSKSAIQYNLGQFRKIIGPHVKLMVVVKSNAYGHGMIPIAKLAFNFGADWLGVVNLDEALELRKAKINHPILVLSYFPWDLEKVKKAIKLKIDLPVYDLKIARLLSKIASKLQKQARIHIKIDTGTSRLGVQIKDAVNFVKKFQKLKNLKIIGIFSHYASSEEKDQTFTNQQTERFRNLLEKLRQDGINIPLAHIACSASTLINPQTHFEMVRVGVAMYGLWPSQNTKKLASKIILRPALTWKTKIIQIKKIAKKVAVGYGCTFKTKRVTKLAILPCGYFEGYFRLLSNKGEALVAGKRCRILGRVCMNLMMVDVTKIKNAKVGDEVVLIGKQGSQEISADKIAKKIGTINYEVVAKINPTLPRIYV